MKLFYVMYEVQQSADSYLVGALTKKQAVAIVRAIHPAYKNVVAWSEKDYIGAFDAIDWEDMLATTTPPAKIGEFSLVGKR